LEAADLINVTNTYDVVTLTRYGQATDKIVVFPFGLFPERSAAFRPAPEAIPDPPVIAFVGSFDPRKGMVDLPPIAKTLIRTLPRARFKLMGTAGLIPTAGGVLNFFPRDVRSNVTVIPRFDPEDLPGLLADCTVAAFPSRLEGFPFAVLEMLAAGLPVVAYDVPGPPMMLPPELLVPRGDATAMAEQVMSLLADRQRLIDARRWARQRSQDFRWDDIVRRTAETYQQRIALRRRAREPAASPA
jgi:glycosyltransferase involved in cell wall biosynthesis